MNTNLNLKANGKLLISGEYLVLNKAKSLAFPICFGQEMNVSLISEPVLKWESTENDIIWFTVSYTMSNLTIINTSDINIAEELKKLLNSARIFNPEFLSDQYGFSVKINANYSLKWGFGSSSTLISLIARWANINEFSLYRQISNGSAYDLACATEKTPIFYQLTDNKPIITQTEFGNGLKYHSLFAYLGNKQDSKQEVEFYKNNISPTQKQIERISNLANEFSKASNADELIEIINEHELIISSILRRKTLAQQRFPDFQGAVKSLGAWGGDFALFTSKKPVEELRADLKYSGIFTMFSYNELLIKE